MSWFLIISTVLLIIYVSLIVKRKGRNLYENFHQHPALTNLQRDYEYAVIGGRKAYQQRCVSLKGLNWGIPNINICDIERVLQRYYSLVKEGGTIYFLLSQRELDALMQTDKSHSFLNTILHPWCLPVGTRHDYGRWLLFKDPIWFLELLVDIHSVFSKHRHLGEKIEKLTKVLIEMNHFLNERNRSFVVLMEENTFKSLHEGFRVRGLCCRTHTKQML